MAKEKKTKPSPPERGTVTIRNVNKTLWRRAGVYAKRCGIARWALLEEALLERLARDC